MCARNAPGEQRLLIDQSILVWLNGIYVRFYKRVMIWMKQWLCHPSIQITADKDFAANADADVQTSNASDSGKMRSTRAECAAFQHQIIYILHVYILLRSHNSPVEHRFCLCLICYYIHPLYVATWTVIHIGDLQLMFGIIWVCYLPDRVVWLRVRQLCKRNEPNLRCGIFCTHMNTYIPSSQSDSYGAYMLLHSFIVCCHASCAGERNWISDVASYVHMWADASLVVSQPSCGAFLEAVDLALFKEHVAHATYCSRVLSRDRKNGARARRRALVYIQLWPDLWKTNHKMRIYL